MRLWHYKLIPVLPRQQLLGQWRECCLIAKEISEKGTPNHILVNPIIDYPVEEFLAYTNLISDEMINRGYKADIMNFRNKLCEPVLSWSTHMKDDLFPGWHTDEYLKQCYYNLEEKYDRGGISDEEWTPIKNLMENRSIGKAIKWQS